MEQVFISYRRKNWPFTRPLVKDLRARLNALIYIDLDSIDNVQFEQSILPNLRKSDVFLLIVTEQTFAPERIHRDDDWVRREIREAIKYNIPIILVSVDGVLPPSDLPNDLQTLRNYQAVKFYPEYYENGLDRLVDFITKAIPSITLREVDLSSSQREPINQPKIKSNNFFNIRQWALVAVFIPTIIFATIAALEIAENILPNQTLQPLETVTERIENNTPTPTITALAMSTENLTPYPESPLISTLLPTPTLIATLPPSNHPRTLSVGTNDIVMESGNVRVHVQQIVSPSAIGGVGADVGNELLAFEMQVYNYHTQSIVLYQDQYTLSFPDNNNVPGVALDRNRSQAYAQGIGRGFVAPDFPASLLNRLEIPSQRVASVALVFQVPANTSNVYLNIKFPNDVTQTRSLLLETNRFRLGTMRVINEGNPYDPAFSAYTLLGYEIGETEVLLGAEKIDEQVESNCSNDTPVVIEVVTQEAYAFSSSRTITNLNIGPRVDVNISGEDLVQIVVMPSRALTSFLNILTFSLDVESSRESTQEFISESTQKTETITIPPNYELFPNPSSGS